MQKPPQGHKVYPFVDLEIIVPDQSRWVRVVEKPLPPLESMPGSKGFNPLRLIGNIAIVDYDDPEQVVTTFDPPIELNAIYHDLDLYEAAHTTRTLKLAYWNGWRWVVFSTRTHHFELLPPNDGGIGKAKIARWAGDPPVAWGT